jgi:type I restriction enzyme S subunit
MPRGWAGATVGDIAEETRQPVDPGTLDATTPYVGLAHIPRRSIALCDWGDAYEAQSTKLRFHKGDILFAKIRPYFHKVAVAPVDGVCSSDTIVIRPTRPECYSLVLCCVSSDEFVAHSVQTAQGTKMPRANWDVMRAFPVAVPPTSLLERFSDVIGNLVDLICNLVLSTRALRSARDLLLPRLISGELDASNINIDTDEDEL